MQNAMTRTTFDYDGLSETTARGAKRLREQFRELQSKLNRDTAETIEAMAQVLEKGQSLFSNHKTGTFLKWADAELGMSKSSVYRTLETAKFIRNCPNVGTISGLDRTALELVASNSCPEPARVEVLKRAVSGPVTHKTAKEIVAKHKPPKAARATRQQKQSEPPPKESGPIVTGTSAYATDGNCEVIEVESRVIEESAELAMRAALMAIFKDVSRLSDDALKAYVRKGITDLVEALSTGQAPEQTEPEKAKPPKSREAQAKAIYRLYPRKVAPAKALAAIEKALKNGVSYETLAEAVTEYAESRKGKDEQFTPHPATWFNQGRWEDDRSEWWRPDTGRNGSAREPSSGERFDPNIGPVRL